MKTLQRASLFLVIMTMALCSVQGQGLTIGSNTSFSLGYSTLSIPGDWMNEGSFYANNGTIIFDGTSEVQTLTNASGEIFYNLVVNKAFGDVQLMNNCTVNGTLSLDSGDLDLNGKTITLGSSGLLNETPGNTVKGTSGVITTTRILTAPSISTDIAGLGFSIGSAANLGSTVISRGHTVQNGGSSILRYYQVAPTNNSGLSASVKFVFDESELNGKEEDCLGLIRSTNLGVSWDSLGGIVNTTSHSLTFSSTDMLGRFSLKDFGVSTLLIPLNTGWSLVSVPLLQSDYSAELVFPGKFGSMFKYNAGASKYEEELLLGVGYGYWIYYSSGTTGTISGSTPGSISINCQTGWNLIGSSNTPRNISSLVLNNGAAIFGSAFRYNTSSHGYEEATVIAPGEAVWIYITNVCTLTIP